MDDDDNQSKNATESTTVSPKNEKDSLPKSLQRRGFFSFIWNGIFGRRNEDFEKKLQYLSKEEASVHARAKRRMASWRKMSRNLIVYAVIFEVVAVAYAIMTTRSLDLTWKMRALRVLPVFMVPGLSAAIYSMMASYVRMRDRKDKKTLERLRAERQAKIDELKERTNYYLTQQLIQRYDLDPAAKAAAASVLVSKLGADSGVKVVLEEDPKLNATEGKSNSIEVMQANDLRKRKQSHERHSEKNILMEQQPVEGDPNIERDLQSPPVVVEHHPGSTKNDGGWIARIAAMLVGEDSTQCYALICGNCHMHNGLARKEDFPYITYYCPYCHALNGSRRTEAHGSLRESNSPSAIDGNIGIESSEKTNGQDMGHVKEAGQVVASDGEQVETNNGNGVN
ncbi:uncharacterized protein At2g24330 [Amborella trichopoda]|uniref:uncharacterized protein At2g24330 n=1 Tax=Amborella trichopoda TaxID=13333 RepID=UPI0005D3D0C0|nr:uncharacterized protein At2g24330 [Amborella trichopoda]XP_020521306.1 uncharacterized protein At2g24330 [Amborella trichopoda]XP_020521307.1 uncharacterized protein At2g24330 [Amborella trichopoda]XP_020521308.1 uncharacterized protein At2g24330 [Amborella trichopoda]|eukprot:XP_011622256.1 uncharacterized protein At2g24330 [Amborella trichopoda]